MFTEPTTQENGGYIDVDAENSKKRRGSWDEYSEVVKLAPVKKGEQNPKTSVEEAEAISVFGRILNFFGLGK